MWYLEQNRQCGIEQNNPSPNIRQAGALPASRATGRRRSASPPRRRVSDLQAAGMAAFAWLLIAAAVHARPPDLLSLVPTSGPVEGGTRLTLTGAGLAGDFSLVCRFGQGQRSQVPGTFEGLSSHGRVYCSESKEQGYRPMEPHDTQ